MKVKKSVTQVNLRNLKELYDQETYLEHMLERTRREIRHLNYKIRPVVESGSDKQIETGLYLPYLDGDRVLVDTLHE